MTASQGMLAKLGIGESDPVDFGLNFSNERLMVDEQFHNGNGLRGTFDHNVDRVRRGIRRVGGPITFEPNAEEWEKLLPWILGGTPSGTSYPLADTIPSRYVTVDRVAKVYTYNGAKVDRATIRANRGGPLSLTLDLVALDEAEANAGTFPALTIDTASGPFMFMDCAFTIGGTTYTPDSFSLTIDHRIDKERFFNSATLTDAVMTDRIITFETRLPHGDATAAYNSGPGGVAVVGTFTNGTVSLAFSLVKVCFPRQSPTVPGRSEVMLPLRGLAYKSGSTKPIVTTLDSTP